MAGGKWITDLPPAASFVDAARHVLTIRLETVRHFLDSTQAQIDTDPERVHQLRVGTRRAGAALDVFKPCFPKSMARKSRRFLKRIRRAAGDVRDWDVFLCGLNAWRDKKYSRLRPTLDLVNGLALARRDAARSTLLEAKPDRPFAFERLLTSALGSLSQPGHSATDRLGDVALPFLLSRIEELSELVQSAVADPTKLHRVRILGKRLRYAMEIFGDCFAEPFKERLYLAIEQMQECLGLLHDSDVAASHLQHWSDRAEVSFPNDWPRYRPGFAALINSHKEVVARKTESFWKSWQLWLEADPVNQLASLAIKAQRGELVSIAGNDNTAPGVREALGSAPEPETCLPVNEPGGT